MQSASVKTKTSGVEVEPIVGEVTAAAGVTRGNGRVRRATFADLDAILDINDNIYDGLDYVPELYYIFMQSKQYAIYVCELEDGQLVALCSFYFVPGVEDLVTIMFLRVRASFQGQGFGRPESNPMTNQFRKDYPQVKRYIIQTMLKPNIEAKINQVKLLYRWNIMRRRPVDRLRLESSLNQHENLDRVTKPATLSYTDGVDWLNRNNELQNFLSRYADEYIVTGAKWIPVKVNATELRKVFASDNVLVSFVDIKQNPGPDGVIITPELSALSCSGVFQCKYGVSVVIHFYGDGDTDLLSHVYSHVSHYVRVTQPDVSMSCSVHFPPTVDSSGVQERLREVLGDTFRTDSNTNVEPAVHYVAPL